MESIYRFPDKTVDEYMQASFSGQKKLRDLFRSVAQNENALSQAEQLGVIKQVHDSLPDSGQAVTAANSYTTAPDGKPGILRKIFVDFPSTWRMFNSVVIQDRLWTEIGDSLKEEKPAVALDRIKSALRA